MSATHSPETHRVVALLLEGSRVTTRSLTALPWGEAQAAWNALDNARRAGRLPRVDYLVVRSESDPDWSGAAHELLPFCIGRQRGHATRAGAMRAWGVLYGYKGRQGGWIYRVRPEGQADRDDRPITQGWNSLFFCRRSTHPVAQDPVSRRWYVNDLRRLAESALRSAA